MRSVFILVVFIALVPKLVGAQGSLQITKEKAIAIAKKEGYYKTNCGWNANISLDSSKLRWGVISTHNALSFNPKITCWKVRTMTIDAGTGEIIQRQKQHRSRSNFSPKK